MGSSARPPTAAEISWATERVRAHFDATPLVPYDDTELLYKLESRCPTGSFKVRGAIAALTRYAEEGIERVVAASAGNHGQGVGWAARALGVSATVVVPSGCPAVKVDAMRELVRVIVHDEPGYDAAESAAIELAGRDDAAFVSPFDDTWVMAGNGGSIAMEILTACPHVGTIVVPVGGGGLLAGILAAVETLGRSIDVIAVQSEACPAYATSLEEGRARPTWPPAETLAEGLEGGTGATGVALGIRAGIRCVLVPEEEIAAAIVQLSDRLGEPIEGSAAVVEAARRTGQLAACRRPIVGVLTGGNISTETVERLRSDRV